MSVASQVDAEHAWTTPYSFASQNGWLGKRVAATTSASAAVALVGSGNIIVLTNVGTVECYVALGNSSVAATLSHFPVLAGTMITLSLPADKTSAYISAITASGSTTLLAHVGCGI